jgi:uncharacterized protein (TIGR02996 family)
MSQERAFLQQLQANPADDATRLIYADWLEDQDDPRGRYLRLEVELAALSEQDSRYQTLEEELQGLRGSIEPEWLEAAGNRYDLVLLAYPPHSKIPVIKAIRELTLCGLKEAKDVSERLPAVVLRGVSRPRAEEASEHLRYSFAAARPRSGYRADRGGPRRPRRPRQEDKRHQGRARTDAPGERRRVVALDWAASRGPGRTGTGGGAFPPDLPPRPAGPGWAPPGPDPGGIVSLEIQAVARLAGLVAPRGKSARRAAAR